jgi:hypothetical protein
MCGNIQQLGCKKTSEECMVCELYCQDMTLNAENQFMNRLCAEGFVNRSTSCI